MKTSKRPLGPTLSRRAVRASRWWLRPLVAVIVLLVAAGGCNTPKKAGAAPARWDQARLSATLQLADEHIAAGKFGRARVALAAFHEVGDTRLPLTLARADVEEGHYAVALQRLDAVAPPTSKPPTYQRLRGIALEGLGRWEEAGRAYREAYLLEPSAYLLAAWIDALVLDGQSADARVVLERERHRFPGEPAIHMLAARLHEQAGNHDAVVSELVTAALAQPESSEIRRRLAEAYTSRGCHTDAVRTWRQLLAESRNAEERQRLRGRLARSLMRAERFDEARRVYREIAFTRPDDEATRLGLAVACLTTGHPADALEAALKVLRSTAGNADARLIAALSYRRLGQVEQAVGLLSDLPPEADPSGLARALLARWE